MEGRYAALKQPACVFKAEFSDCATIGSIMGIRSAEIVSQSFQQALADSQSLLLPESLTDIIIRASGI